MNKKRILVIGGSYFVGKVFTIYSSDKYELTLVNRGSRSMTEYPVTELHFDRNNAAAWKNVKGHYDAIVDFCAYNVGEIETVFENFGGNFNHYILISTLYTYKAGTHALITETSPIEDLIFHGSHGAYVYGKRRLEAELSTCAIKSHKSYTILKPGNIYGEYNYKERETELFKRLINDQPLYHITDGKANFQLVYVGDVVNAIQAVIDIVPKENYYNIIPNKSLNYDDLNRILLTFKEVPVEDHTIAEAEAANYPLPFPIYAQEQETYDGSLFRNEFNYKYISLEEGLKASYDFFVKEYKNEPEEK